MSLYKRRERETGLPVWSRHGGDPLLESNMTCHVDYTLFMVDADLLPSASSTGFVSTFKRAGFKIVARHVPPRPIMRFDFEK